MSHDDYEARVIESMAKNDKLFGKKHVPEVKLAGSYPPVSQFLMFLKKMFFNVLMF